MNLTRLKRITAAATLAVCLTATPADAQTPGCSWDRSHASLAGPSWVTRVRNLGCNNGWYLVHAAVVTDAAGNKLHVTMPHAPNYLATSYWSGSTPGAAAVYTVIAFCPTEAGSCVSPVVVAYDNTP